MRAILMAAGVGSRLGHSVSRPKCTLEVDGEPLIRRTVRMLLEHGISTAIVVGYKREMVYQALDGLQVTYYYNPFYKVTNSMASLWFAREYLDGDEDVILGNADVFWDESILDLLLSDQREAVMLSDASRAAVGDYFFRTENGRIMAYGKELPREYRDCEYVGVAKLKASFVKKFRMRVSQCVEHELYDMWWENVLYNYSAQTPVYAIDVEGRFWCEIDYVEDYERIIQYIACQRERLRADKQ